MKVLIAYASKHRSTREIAERIGRIVGARHEVEITPVDAVTRVDGYEAAIVGSAVYEGEWLPNAASFLRENAEALSRHPLWLFSSGAIGHGDPEAVLQGWHFPPSLETLHHDLHPQDTVVFGGRLDEGDLSLGDWLRNPHLRGSYGDFRDWGSIDAWARGVANSLSAREAAVRRNGGGAALQP